MDKNEQIKNIFSRSRKSFLPDFYFVLWNRMVREMTSLRRRLKILQASNALAMPLVLQGQIKGGDYFPSGGSPICVPVSDNVKKYLKFKDMNFFLQE